MKDVIFASDREDWETPQWLFDELDQEFHFKLDVAATSKNTKCMSFYDRELDGLKRPWYATVWCNPPYGRQVSKWVKKASESKCTTVMLLFARTDTHWFHKYIYNKPNVEVRFLEGRIKFVGAKNNAPAPSMIVIWRNENA